MINILLAVVALHQTDNFDAPSTIDITKQSVRAKWNGGLTLDALFCRPDRNRRVRR
jgi:hypothetical protein